MLISSFKNLYNKRYKLLTLTAPIFQSSLRPFNGQNNSSFSAPG